MSGSDPATLPPDLARKVLGADLRNIVKKAGDGATLTTQERKLVREFLSEKIEPEELLEARRNALLQMWAAGRKLSPQEFAEIAEYLPIEARLPTKAAPDLVLEASTAPVPGKYLEKIGHYAAHYEQGDRTIKRWIAKGRKTDDPPPLDDPIQMPSWFPRHHKHRVPEILVKRAAEARGVVTVEVPEETAQADGPPPPPTYRPPSEMPIGSGFEAELQRVREEAQKAAGILADAEKSGNTADIDDAQRKQDRALKRLREFERDASKILTAQGSLVDQSVVEALLLPKHAAIRADLEAGYTFEVHRELRSPLEFAAARKIYLAVIHRALRSLVAGGFGDRAADLTLEAA
jgi:hypothetical protein